MTLGAPGIDRCHGTHPGEQGEPAHCARGGRPSAPNGGGGRVFPRPLPAPRCGRIPPRRPSPFGEQRHGLVVGQHGGIEGRQCGAGVEVHADEHDLVRRGDVGAGPFDGRLDGQVRAGLAPHLRDLQAIGDPAVALGADQAARGAQGGDQAIVVERAIAAEGDGGNPVLLGFRGVRVRQLLCVAAVRRGGGFVVKPRIQDDAGADLAIRDAQDARGDSSRARRPRWPAPGARRRGRSW